MKNSVTFDNDGNILGEFSEGTDQAGETRNYFHDMAANILNDAQSLSREKIASQSDIAGAFAMRQMEARANLRGDIFKTLSGAIIQEKLAQKQHARDMERLEKERAMRGNSKF